ncbi:MAG TPA: alpha-L-fucosidase [bacterium]|nr:alpha-L-fucosidase [bacterium]
MDRRKFVRSCGAGSALALAPALNHAARAGGPDPFGARRDEQLGKVERAIAQGPFADSWESLSTYRAPQWYEDAKFGIFIHWGVYSVPAYENEWYPRNMYRKGSRAWWRHRMKWGPQDRFGYKDFIPMFKADKFDPAAWIELFQKAGARYVVPVAEHHDGFAMYDCSLTDWSAAKMGPRRDVVGELKAAAEQAGLVFGLSSHRAEHWWFYDGGRHCRSDVADPRYESLYGPAMPRDSAPDERFLADWLARSAELVDRYAPRVFWFDWWIEQPAFEPWRRKFAAYYYNRAAERGHEAVLNYKNQAFPEGSAVLDLERSGLAEIRPLVWQTDTSVSYVSWGYINPRADLFKDPGRLIGDLVDVVSKNGVLLLNVGPAPDGAIPAEVQEILIEVGRWLEVNGPAVYGARPWKIFGEGPNLGKRNNLYGVGELASPRLGPRDIRFTRKGATLYALVMGWPSGRSVAVKSLGKNSGLAAGQVSSVRLLGSTSALPFTRHDDALIISLPPEKPCEHAVALEIGGALEENR